MNKYIVNRVLEEANYIIKTNHNIRDTAKKYNVSKSTVHKDLSERLLEIDTSLYKKITNIFANHLDLRHINGGEATRKKYAKL
ncbi:MAG: sporulation transcriptional regulator SpoIIID [Bacilli bacterium]